VLGKTYSIDFSDFHKGEVRKANLEKAIFHLRRAKDKEIGIYHQKLTYFTLADAFRRSDNTSAAKETLNKFVERFSIDDRHPENKAAIPSFARTWTVDLKHRKIRVNAVSPGPIDTPAFNSLAQTEEEIRQIKVNLVAAVPMGRIGNPDEIAKAVSFLASDDSSYITGIELFVDGGMAQI